MDNIGLFVVITLAVIFVSPYIYMHVSAKRSVGKAVPVDNLPDDENVNLEKTIYCYFMSASCSMCKSMTPIIEKLRRGNSNIFLIDINKHPELAKSFHVYGTPTLMAIDEDSIKKVKLGKLRLEKINQFICEQGSS